VTRLIVYVVVLAGILAAFLVPGSGASPVSMRAGKAHALDYWHAYLPAVFGGHGGGPASTPTATASVTRTATTTSCCLATWTPTRTLTSTRTATARPTATQTPVSGGGIVYITETGSKYHRDGCAYLSGSKIQTTRAYAVSHGYTPCSVCKPVCP
jgi:hypothetical protein